MNLSEIIKDAFVYPFHNIKSLLIYVILGIIGALLAGASVLSIATALSTGGITSVALTGASIAGVVIFVLILFLASGYTLDIIKYGIERRDDGPGIEIGRQISNAVKLIVVDIIYYIIPIIISFVLGLFLRDWLMTVVSIILFIVFSLANFMAKCRLAKSDSLGESLAVGEAIGDISRVGFGKLLATFIVIAIILVIFSFIISWVMGFQAIVGSILLGIFSIYYLFFYNRAIGLLYSNV